MKKRKLIIIFIVFYLSLLTLFFGKLYNDAFLSDVSEVQHLVDSIQDDLEFLSKTKSIQNSIKYNSSGSSSSFLDDFLNSRRHISAAVIYDKNTKNIFSFSSKNEKPCFSEIQSYFLNHSKEDIHELEFRGEKYLYFSLGSVAPYFIALLLPINKVLTRSKYLRRIDVVKGKVVAFRKWPLSFSYTLIVLFFFIIASGFIFYFFKEGLTLISTISTTVDDLAESKTPNVKNESFFFKKYINKLDKAAKNYEKTTQEKILETAEKIAVMQSASEIAHDSMSALASVSGLFSMLEENIQDGLKNSDLLNKNKKQVEAQLTFAEAMMEDLQNLGSPKDEIKKSQVVQKIIDDNLNTLKLISSNDVYFHHNISSDLKIMATSSIYRAFYNLMKNCMEAAGYKGEVWVKASPKNGIVHFEFGNKGSYIPKDLKNKLMMHGGTFGKQNGHGLGLAIVKKLLAENDSTFEIYSSEESNETVFKFDLKQDFDGDVSYV